ALVTLVVGFNLFGLAPASASEGFEVGLQMPGEVPFHNGQGQPVWIAGVWHDLSLTLESAVQDVLSVEASAIGVPGGGVGSHYRWERNERNDNWTDLLYGFFIQPEFSQSTGNQVVFRVGIDAAAVAGTWSIVVIQDGAFVGDQSIEVRTPKMAFGVSSADFNLRGEPFQGVELFSEDRNQYLRIINDGNVPLRLSITFDRLQSRLRLIKPSDVVHVNSEVKYFVSVNIDPRPPQIVEVNGIARVEVSGLIPSPGAAQIVPALESTFDLKVIIGRSGYIVQVFGNVVFQTLNSLRADYGSVVTWDVFLTGDENVAVDVEVTGARLVGVFQGETPLTLPATLSPPANAELALTVQVSADLPSTVAEVVFTLELPRTGEIRLFRTSIIVGPRPAPGPLSSSYLWIFASLVTASVLAFVSYSHLQEGTRGRPPREARNRAMSKRPHGKKGKSRENSRKGEKKPGSSKGGKGKQPKGGGKKRDKRTRTKKGGS
ncbi:MAG: hypothetical protein LN413_07250, partial [Candidatus Thermoplasmatota archaeon]|nr:hypothetical protein [Candidatus Thermoplasmatota archaeon]